MLALDPKKRLTVDQIKQHPWMRLDEETEKENKSIDDSDICSSCSSGSILHEVDVNHDAVLKIMKLLGIEISKTIEVTSSFELKFMFQFLTNLFWSKSPKIIVAANTVTTSVYIRTAIVLVVSVSQPLSCHHEYLCLLI